MKYDVVVVGSGPAGSVTAYFAAKAGAKVLILERRPVIGVPVSTGYGHGGQGHGALTTMLQSCALGLSVVNIDNGIAAGATAALIANHTKEKQ